MDCKILLLNYQVLRGTCHIWRSWHHQIIPVGRSTLSTGSRTVEWALDPAACPGRSESNSNELIWTKQQTETRVHSYFQAWKQALYVYFCVVEDKRTAGGAEGDPDEDRGRHPLHRHQRRWRVFHWIQAGERIENSLLKKFWHWL